MLENGPQAARLGGRHRNADRAQQPALWQSLRARDLGPRITTIDGLENAAARTTAYQQPRLAPGLPEGDVHDLRVRRIHDHVRHTGAVVAEQDVLPRAAAVGRAIHAAFLVRTEHVTQRAHEYDVGVVGIDAHARDVLRLFETHVRPRFAGIDGLPHAVAMRHVATNWRFTTAHPHHIGIAVLHGNRANGAAKVLVGYGDGSLATIHGLPDAAAGGAHVVLVGTGDRAGNGDHATGLVRADVAPGDPEGGIGGAGLRRAAGAAAWLGGEGNCAGGENAAGSEDLTRGGVHDWS